MANILKILIQAVAAIWPLFKKHPKKSIAAAGVTSAALLYSGGVQNPPPTFHPGNSADPTTASDGDAWIYDQAQARWEPGAGGGGGGSSIETPDGTTTVSRLPSYNPYDYGAAGTMNQATLAGTESAGSTTIDLTTGQGTGWREGNSLIIPGAGPAHQWAAVTPSAPTVGNGGTVTFTCSTSTDLITVAAYCPWIANGQEVKVYATTSLPTVGGTPFTDGDSWFLRLGTHQNTFTVHPTSADATNNTNAYNFDGAGSGTLSLSPVGGTTHTYRIACNSGGGGRTVRSAEASTTTATSTLGLNSYNVLWWDPIDDGSGNFVHGYEIYGRTDDHFLTAVNAAPNAVKITCQAGGYTNFAPTDIGKQLYLAPLNRGEIIYYDNTSRVIILKLRRDGEGASYTAGTAISVNGGEGAGTITGTTTFCYCWKDCGDTETEYDYRTWAWRSGVEQQRYQISGTPTGGTYVLAWGGYQTSALAYNATSSTVQAALRLIPGLATVSVSSSGSTPNFTMTVTFRNGEFGMGNVPQLKILSSMTGGTPVYNVVTTVPGCSYNPGQLVLNPATSSGTWQECRWSVGDRAGGSTAPSFSSTLNTSVDDMHDVRWVRANSFYPVTSPSAAVPDAYKGEVTGVSSDALTVTPATDSEVTSGTPVMHDDLPAFKDLFAAVAAAGGGTIDIPSGDFNFYTRRDSNTDDWSAVPGAGLGNKTLWNINKPDASIVFRGGNSVIRWRPFQVRAYFDDGGTTADDSAVQVMLNLQSLSHFAMRDLKWYCCPGGEPQLEGETGEGGGIVFAPYSNGANNATNGRQYINNCDFIGFGGLGFFHEANVDSSRAVFIDRMLLRYGAGGHTAGIGAGQSQVEISNSRIEGTNTLWKSDALYTSDVSQSPVKLFAVDFVQPGQQCLRIRNPYFEMYGGSIVSTLDFDTNNTQNALIRAIYLENGRGHRIDGVFVNTYGEGIDCATTDCNVSRCVLHNAGIALNSVDGAAIGNSLYTTDWRRGSPVNAISVAGRNARVNGNMVFCSETVSSAAQGICVTSGIYISGASATNVAVSANTVQSSGESIYIDTTAVGTITITGGSYYSYDLDAQSVIVALYAGSGADVLIEGATFNGLVTSDEVVCNQAGPANYRLKNNTFLCSVAFGSLLTGTNNVAEGNFFKSSTAARFLDVGTFIYRNDFAVAPTLTGTLLATAGNKVGSTPTGVLSPAALSSGNNNDYALGVTDTHRLDPNASNSTLTSIAARADGTTITIICVDAGAATLTILDDDGATGTAANRIVTPDGADIVLSNNESVVLQYDATSSRWKVVGGGYSSIWNRDAREAFSGNWSLAA